MDCTTSACGACCSTSTSSSSGRSSAGTLDDGGRGFLRLLDVKMQCELCTDAAAFYCAADEARLCRDCDARIHSANFLVARHSRALICACCGAIVKSGLPLRAGGLHVCRACAEAVAARAYEAGVHGDEESRVGCSSGDDEDERGMGHLDVGARKRSFEKACGMEGVGDSEEEEQCHLLSSSRPPCVAAFKRRHTLRPHLPSHL